ncbi:MAG TPA: zinc ABC transporter substrate-binding protein [Steroidobacteraceae bacterium]
MRVLAAFLCLASLGVLNPALAQTSEVQVVTSLPVTYGIASALAQETNIRVTNVPAEGRPMSALARYFETPPQKALETLRAADAVITIGKLWRDDPLFLAARAQNIRVVNIDATEPYSATLTGISLVREPRGEAPWAQKAGSNEETPVSRYFWLGFSHVVRAAEIVAADLMRLSPQHAERIAQNLAKFRRQLFELRNGWEEKFAALEGASLFALSPDFVYLTNDLGLFVDGYFFKQDIDWTDADLAAFRKYLADHAVRVVIHRWEPDARILEAIRAAGAKLVVLRTGESPFPSGTPLTPETWLTQLTSGLEALYAALAADATNAADSAVRDCARLVSPASASAGPRVARVTLNGVPAILRIPPRVRQSPVLLWHGFGPPDSEEQMMQALPLDEVPAVKVYLGLPLFGSRQLPGGMQELAKRQQEDVALRVFEPIVFGAAEELPGITKALTEGQCMRSGEPVALVGFSAGGAAVLIALAERSVPIDAAVTLNASTGLSDSVAAYERAIGRSYAWSPRARALADRSDAVKRYADIARDTPALFLIHGQQDSMISSQSVEKLHDVLHPLYRKAGTEARLRLSLVPELQHSIAPPEIAQTINRDVAQWLLGRSTDG